MEEILCGIKRHGPAFGNVPAGLGFELLPFLLPKPGLIAVDRFLGDENDGVIDDLGQDDAPVSDFELFPH
ncbi:MAG: hypothetical protein IH583_01245 [Candidatus Aminicenantes bacterium]|nr:hypothetical protein [Candidatus Aminicenantes bacterium]